MSLLSAPHGVPRGLASDDSADHQGQPLGRDGRDGPKGPKGPKTPKAPKGTTMYSIANWYCTNWHGYGMLWFWYMFWLVLSKNGTCSNPWFPLKKNRPWIFYGWSRSKSQWRDARSLQVWCSNLKQTIRSLLESFWTVKYLLKTIGLVFLYIFLLYLIIIAFLSQSKLTPEAGNFSPAEALCQRVSQTHQWKPRRYGSSGGDPPQTAK